MNLFAEDVDMSVISPLVDDEPSKADGESSIHHISILGAKTLSNDCFSNNDEMANQSIYLIGAVSLSNDDTSCETDDESTACSVSETEAETNSEIARYPVSDKSAITSSDDGVSSEADDERTTYTASDTVTESDGEDDTNTDSEMSVELLSRKQTEETRMNLIEIAEDVEMDGITQTFAGTVAEIVEWWQNHTKDGSPTLHQVDFGVGASINLLMVFALLPERYQGLICIEDGRRSPSGDGENLSWLHEQTTDILVRLSADPNSRSTFFGQGLAFMIRDDVDEGWRAFTGRSWLEDQLHLLSIGELEPGQYRFPPGTEKAVFLFNPTENHWTVVEVDMDEYVWTYTLYNSLCQGERGPTWKACQEQFPFLEKLICRTSGFAEPATREIVTAASAQQDNPYDCGPIAVYNAIELLEGRQPCTDIDPEELRLRYLMLIRDALYVLDQGLATRAFRVYMRKVCLDYII